MTQETLATRASSTRYAVDGYAERSGGPVGGCLACIGEEGAGEGITFPRGGNFSLARTKRANKNGRAIRLSPNDPPVTQQT